MRTTMRTILVVSLAALGAYAIAQAPFTIIRPAEGARVREVIKVQIPKNSIPTGGYISVALDDKFIEATLPEAKDKVYEYLLDTKKQKVEDGKHVLEVTLYGPVGSTKVGILDKSKVNIVVANHEPVKVPADGMLIKYKFRPGNHWKYDCRATEAVLSISEQEEKNGATASEQLTMDDQYQISIWTDNVHPDGNGVLRCEGIPDDNGYMVFQQPGGQVEAIQYSDITPNYVVLTPSGEEVLDRTPGWVDPWARNLTKVYTVIVAMMPPLPPERVKVSEKWSAMPPMPIETHHTGTSNWLAGIIFPSSSGILEGFEWEQGHPCAHIHYEFAYGRNETKTAKDDKSDKKQMNIRGALVDNAAISFKEEVWFALDLGTVAKSEATLTVEGMSENAAASGGDTGGGASPGSGPVGPGVGPAGGPVGVGPGPSGYGPTKGGGPMGAGMAPPGGGQTVTSGDIGKVRTRLRFNMTLLP